MARHPIVIAGGGPAAVAAAGAARDAGYDGRIVLISEEAQLPYRRPPLSKDYLTGDSDAASLPVRPAAWFDEHGVELMLGSRVGGLDVSRSAVRLDDGSRLEYGALLIATGGRPRRFAGLDHERVVHLRTLADSDLLTKRLRQGEPLVVLGAGFVGCEVAAAARKLGVEVTVLELADVPLRRAIGDRFGALVGDVHREAGVDLRTGEGVSRSPRRGTACWSPPRAAGSSAACCWWRWAWNPTSSSPETCCATTGSWSTRRAAPRRRRCSPPATWPRTCIRCTAGMSASSTTTTR
jgi:3-phenylpropionate/trans-cinnamate dioxygenase ferredoxin reductase subunit